MRALLLACALLGGCALTAPQRPADAPLARGEVRSAQKALEAIPAGSGKAEVRAALGDAAARVPFDSGYEVWVYRERPQKREKAAGKELVLLFDPSGTLSKTRVR